MKEILKKHKASKDEDGSKDGIKDEIKDEIKDDME